MRTDVLFAIFKRNFVSYFSSPIGYVFICAFVLLSAFAAFWPNEFFNANLANLDQLNDKLTWIMLVFIPAITMSTWADERRQGTDELLLTLPATDFEVVMGKYLAALAIFTVSLLFSLSNIVVLAGLGEPDLGLLFANYVGYWLTGAAMISVGMVASFLTSNLTVGFVLAVAFNAPFVFAANADTIIPWDPGARFVKSLSFSAQFADFGRGIIALSALAYFASIAVVMLYLCMVLIGRRHWVERNEKGRGAVNMSAHYSVRALALAAIAVGVCVFFHRFDLRVDTTNERLSSISPRTRELLRKLDRERPVFIEAYVSPKVPDAYVQTRLNLLAMLREIEQTAGDAVVVRINDTERFSREASEAEEQFQIIARQVPDRSGGKFSVEEIHLGAAFLSGLEKVVVPFFDRGIPVEYELVRSIATVSQQERQKVGVVTTDAQLFGGFDMQTMARRNDEQIITELRKQYDVVQVSPSEAIPDDYDVLIAVQPSSLPQPQLDNLIAAVRRGVPTAVFEDPFPFLMGNVPGTSQPRQPPQTNPFMQQQQPPPEPKGNIQQLWTLLGVTFTDQDVVWDSYNPYPKIEDFYPEFLFVTEREQEQAFSQESTITRGLQQILLLFAGAIQSTPDASLTFTPLLRTGRESGTVRYDEIVRRTFFGTSLNPQRRHIPTRESYVVAARIEGDLPASPATPPGPEGETDPAATSTTKARVVLVSDVDVLGSAFFMVRAAGRDPNAEISFDFDNVTFVLNLVDELAGDERFVEIRSRRPKHRTLTAVERRTEDAMAAANDERSRFVDEFEQQRAAEEAVLNEEINKLQQRTDVDAQELRLEVAMKQRVGQNRLQAKIEQLERDRDRKVERIERDLALEVRQVQNRYKLAAVSLPPIPPLILALIVLVRRRSLERVGVPQSRLRTASS